MKRSRWAIKRLQYVALCHNLPHRCRREVSVEAQVPKPLELYFTVDSNGYGRLRVSALAVSEVKIK